VFVPPRCPNQECPAHLHPESIPDGFYNPNGSYQPKCRPCPVPRFKCRVCHRGFSRQTFRVDYCDNKPHLNSYLFKLLASGMGLRQSARILPLSRRCTELKARKISHHLGRLNRNLMDQMPEGTRFSLDEMETFEGERAVLPVTVPILIEVDSMYVVATDVAPIRASGKMSADRRSAIAKAEEREGPRQDLSVSALERIFRRFRVCCRNHIPRAFITDKKQVYGALLRRYFKDQVPHTTISSKQKRDQTNPLRQINLTNAMARDLNGRLRRESWLVSKQRKFLKIQLHVFAAYRNFIRRRVNWERETPAVQLGFLPREATFEELLSWRQLWRKRSIHPLARGTASIEDVRKSRSLAA
jgi:hypothetical protein